MKCNRNNPLIDVCIVTEWDDRMVEIPMPSNRLADIAARSLAVDGELKPQMIQRIVEAKNDSLVVTFNAKSLRLLRTSLSSFLDAIHLVIQTIAQF